ncbi:hypothetical protein AV530_017928 [Patagioenas fasciata monilis]|uniref:Muniscin C-terminal domain-containing protein n=1 Tax=Patagioenas fasciata monilis TaxID=372326 RepID=A0A1V4K350_PATFA|nr:hypothetical protein AV530_017928 [Patagioenas fasciata monilis]
MTLGSICHNSLSEQERLCVVLDCCMLHQKLITGVSGVVHAYDLWVEDVNLEEVAGCQLLKPVLVPSSLHFAWFHQSSFFSNLDDSYYNTIDIAYGNHTRPTTPLSVGTIVPPPRPVSRPKLSTGKLSGINEIPRPFSPPLTSNPSPPPAAPLAHAESISSISSSASLSAANTPTVGVSRGPSPVRLGNQDTLPVAVALTESVNAYFKGADPTKCIVKITGDMTVSFPMISYKVTPVLRIFG